MPGVLPVGMMHHRRVTLDVAKHLGPVPIGARRHGQSVQLRGRQACLDLEVGFAARREEVLPMAAALMVAPAEHLAVAQHRRRRFDEARPICPQGCFPRHIDIVGLEEVLVCRPRMQRIRRVFVVECRQHRHLTIRVVVAFAGQIGVDDFFGRCQHTHVWSFVYGGIRPPVHRCRVIVGIGDARVRNQPR